MSNGTNSVGLGNSPYGQAPQGDQKVRPSGGWYFLSVLFLLAGLGVGVLMVTQFVGGFVEMISSMERFQAPGKLEVTFDKAGTYAIYLVGDCMRPDLQDLTITVTSEGVEIPLEEIDPSGDMTINNEPFEQLYRFQLDKPATVVVRALVEKGPEATKPSTTTKKIVMVGNRSRRRTVTTSSDYVPTLAVGPEFQVADIFALMGKMFLGIGSAIVGFLVAMVIFIVVIVRRSNCKKRIAAGMS
jgi:hypothetical protein